MSSQTRQNLQKHTVAINTSKDEVESHLLHLINVLLLFLFNLFIYLFSAITRIEKMETAGHKRVS